MCLCDGYHLVDGSCTDFDESIATPDICGDDANIDCKNRDAVIDGMPYECTCGIGWEQNAAGDTCVDVDECPPMLLTITITTFLLQVHVIALTALFALIMMVPMHVLVIQDTK